MANHQARRLRLTAGITNPETTNRVTDHEPNSGCSRRHAVSQGAARLNLHVSLTTVMTVTEAIQKADSILPGLAAPDGEDDPRWQAIISIGEFVETQPDAVWGFVARWGKHPNEDLRSAVATCLLEHLLEHHFGLIFPRVERMVLASRRFAWTFCMCSQFGQATLPANARRFARLQRST